jgi:hypothetical protein
MNDKTQITLARLKDALKRLIIGRPKYVKSTGKLTLNKINIEARLGGSYIHKFPDFKLSVAPVILEFNSAQTKFLNGDISANEFNAIRVEILHGDASEDELQLAVDIAPLNEKICLTKEEALRADFNREKRLKEQYREERDDALKARKELEALNNTLMYRLYELQQELSSQNLLSIKDLEKF